MVRGGVGLCVALVIGCASHAPPAAPASASAPAASASAFVASRPSASRPSASGPGASVSVASRPSASGPSASASLASPPSATSAVAPAKVVAEKIDGALPETKSLAAFARRHDCGAKGCNLARLVPDGLEGQLEPDAPVFLFEEGMPAKVSLLLPRVAGIDVYGVVLDGELSVVADDLKEKQRRVVRMTGFRAPGAGVNLYAKEPTRAILALVVAGATGTAAGATGTAAGATGTAAGATGTVAEHVAKLVAKDKSVAWAKRPGAVVTFDLAQKPDLAWGGGAYHVRLGLEEPPASLALLTMSKNASVAEHVHEHAWEFLALLDGSGKMVRKTSGSIEVAGATFASMRPGEAHAFLAAGDKPTYALQLYWPPGPEQRFKKLAEASP